MRRKVLALILALTMFGAMSMTAFADGGATVTFTENNTLEYSDVTTGESGVNLSDAFKGVVPGETKTLVIHVTNENSHTADFYMSADVIKALEEDKENAKGAGYDVVLMAGETEIYNSKLGGYVGNVADGTGIAAMDDALNEDILFATLKNGETTEVTLSITFDGEAMGSDYTGTTGQIAFNFKAGYKDPTGTTVVVREVTKEGQVRYVKKIIEIVENAVPLGAVPTGDGAMIGLAVVVLLLGGFLLILGKKKKVEE